MFLIGRTSPYNNLHAVVVTTYIIFLHPETEKQKVYIRYE